MELLELLSVDEVPDGLAVGDPTGVLVVELVDVSDGDGDFDGLGGFVGLGGCVGCGFLLCELDDELVLEPGAGLVLDVEVELEPDDWPVVAGDGGEDVLDGPVAVPPAELFGGAERPDW